MAGTLKKALASTVAAVALGTGAVAQAEETQSFPKEKIEHVQNNDTFLESGMKKASWGLQKLASGLTRIVTWPVEKITHLTTETVRTSGDFIGDIGNAIGDEYVTPTINSVTQKASDFVENTVYDATDLIHSAVNNTTDLVGDTLEGVASVASGKPEKGLRTIGGSVVQNTAKTAGVIVEKTNNTVVNTVDLGLDVGADAVHNIAIRPITHATVNTANIGTDIVSKTLFNKDLNKPELSYRSGEMERLLYGKNAPLNNLSDGLKKLPDNAHVLAESLQDVTVDAAKLAGTTIRTGLNIAGNVGDASIRGQLPNFIETIEPHLEPFAEGVKKDVNQVEECVKSSSEAFKSTLEHGITSSVGMDSLTGAAEKTGILDVAALTTSMTVNGTRNLTLLNTLKNLQVADTIVETANEAVKENVGKSEPIQEILSALSGKNR